MNIPQELPSPMLDAASESQPDEPSDSTATPEPDALQDSPTITQPLMPSTPENSVQYTDSYFTRQLEDHEERVITNKFVGNVYITFDTHDENMRAHKSLLPRNFYRTFYETSATLSSYVTVDTHVKHRMEANLKIDSNNAFQPIAKFSIHQCALQEPIERHLTWNQKEIPSAYISVFNNIKDAKKRANFHYVKSQRIGQRVSIAKIQSNHLIPATIRGLCESTISIIPMARRFDFKSKTYTQQVDIPVWIHKKAKDRYSGKITPEQWVELGAEMWMCITELQWSNFFTVYPKIEHRNRVNNVDHRYEWLCCGAIPKDLVTGVWPWDGERLYKTDPRYQVRSFKNSGQTWVWNWGRRMWLLETYSASMTVAQVSTKRQRTDDAASNGKDKIAHCECCKTGQRLSMSTIQAITS